VTTAGIQVGGRRRGAFIALAFLALVLKVAAPPGFMFDAKADGRLGLVICTGHGPLKLDDRGGKAPAQKSRSDAPCAFAGNVAPPEPKAFALQGPRVAFVAAIAPQSRPDQAPGRGLAAPPPPAVGPPVLI
jgi:hypothetical protein